MIRIIFTFTDYNLKIKTMIHYCETMKVAHGIVAEVMSDKATYWDRRDDEYPTQMAGDVYEMISIVISKE